MNWTPKDLKALRKKYQLSQAKLSGLLGVTDNYIYLLEREVKRPSKTLMLLLDCVEKQLKENEKGKEKGQHGKRHL
jgi:DNA-binding transcriptional regulator YiaG